MAPHFYFIGIAGFEPTHRGVKVPSLTAWLYPKNVVWHKVESNHRHTGLQPAALPTELSRLYMIPSTLLAPYVGEPYNQQVFEHLPSTVRQILFVFFYHLETVLLR